MVEMPIEVKNYFLNGRKEIIKVKPTDNYTLEITFDNQEIRVYEMRDELVGVFSILKNVDKFKEVFIDENGNIAWDKDNMVDSNLVWNNRIDICKDSVYMNSTEKTKEVVKQ